MAYLDNNSPAPFNSAIDTLMRLGKILDDMRSLVTNPILSNHQKQSMKVRLTKDYFIVASPLLKAEIKQKLKERCNNLMPNEKNFVSTKGGIVQKSEVKSMFSWELEQKLDNFLVDVEDELQKDGYFMPPRKDLSKAITEM